MDIAVIVFFIVVLIITARITVSLKFEFNVYENIGEVKIMLFNFIRVLSVQVKVSGPFIKLIKSGEEDKLVKIDLEDKNVKFVTDFQKNITNRIYLIAFNSKVIFGNEDSFLTANIFGLLQIANRVMFAKILKFENDATINMQTFPIFAQNKLEFFFNMKFIVSIFDLIYAVIKTLLEGRTVSYGKSQNKFKK